MLCNRETVIIGENVILVPYQVEHVPKYHGWMQSEELRSLTASEPLTLEQEYEMQQKWQMDEDKLTFIILAREGTLSASDSPQPTDPRVTSLPMVGDVNLFFSGAPPTRATLVSRPSRDADDRDDVQEFTAEAEIMIAEPSYRRRGFAGEALRLMFQYATACPQELFICSATASPQPVTLQDKLPHPIPPSSLITRISETNTPSIRLFEKLGFQITKHVKVFEEVEMRWKGPQPNGMS